MNLRFNSEPPRIMHIDLNSCFATIEQQANRRHRRQPVAVAAYSHPSGIIIAASYEAKALGIGLGTRVGEARKICPKIYITEPDPPKYRHAHELFRQVLEQYTNEITPKSIDEFILDMKGSPSIENGQTMPEIGREIKQQIYDKVGEAVRCNVGIGPNRFLAKLAAGLNKPNGLDIITTNNLESVYSRLKLTDLPGINRRLNVRLKLANINTPLEFLHAPREILQKSVFRGIAGHYWWLRLRGWEIDNQPTKLSQIGHQYSIPSPERRPENLIAIIAKLSEKTGHRLREKGLSAARINLGVKFSSGARWKQTLRPGVPLFASQGIFKFARKIFSQIPEDEIIFINLSVHDFAPADPEQLCFLAAEIDLSRVRQLANATDKINNRWGEFSLYPASMLPAATSAKDAIAFGNLR